MNHDVQMIRNLTISYQKEDLTYETTVIPLPMEPLLPNFPFRRIIFRWNRGMHDPIWIKLIMNSIYPLRYQVYGYTKKDPTTPIFLDSEILEQEIKLNPTNFQTMDIVFDKKNNPNISADNIAFLIRDYYQFILEE